MLYSFIYNLRTHHQNVKKVALYAKDLILKKQNESICKIIRNNIKDKMYSWNITNDIQT